MVKVKTKTISLAVLLCFYTIFVFSINPFMTKFPGMSFEVTDQNNEGVFSSLSRNFDQTIEEINNGDEKGAQPPLPSTDSSNNAEKKVLPPQPPPPPQPTLLTMLGKRALLLMSQLRLSSLLIPLATIRPLMTIWRNNNQTDFNK